MATRKGGWMPSGAGKVFGYGINPSKTSIKELLGKEEFARFPEDTKVGTIKEGVLNRD